MGSYVLLFYISFLLIEVAFSTADEDLISGRKVMNGSPGEIENFPYQSVEISRWIVGGTAVHITAYPHHVAIIFNRNQYNCGGSIISSNWVLSAAHCVENRNYMIRAGSSRSDIGGTTHYVIKIFPHSNYNPKTPQDDDIALLKIHPPFNFDNTRQPIKLWSRMDKIRDGDVAFVSGFGQISDYGHLSVQLLAVEAPIFNWNKCRDLFYKALGVQLSQNVYCAGEVPTKSSCFGDSGGPLIFRHKLLGIVCGGLNCSLPIVYTKVSSYLDWIKNIMEQNY